MQSREWMALLIGAVAVAGIILVAIIAKRRERRTRGPKHISVDLAKKD